MPTSAEDQERFDAFMERMAASDIVGARFAVWLERVKADALRDRELHHFETEQENARLRAEVERLR